MYNESLIDEADYCLLHHYELMYSHLILYRKMWWLFVQIETH